MSLEKQQQKNTEQKKPTHLTFGCLVLLVIIPVVVVIYM